ncbi:hypothetical protein PHYC_01455 [Phycisphaerales bacterium]|nr:hypothetical protein PHYC_01455 [Phycisphaerales bacterium]
MSEPIEPTTSWYFAAGQERVGPLGDTEFRTRIEAGEVRPEMLVWRKGMGAWAPASSVPELQLSLAAGHPARVTAPPRAPGQIGRPAGGGDATGGLIPYKNGPALAGYYTSVVSLIPVVGLVLGPVAFGLGLAGWRKAQANPVVSGKAHSVVAMVLGGLTTLSHVALVVVMLVSR